MKEWMGIIGGILALVGTFVFVAGVGEGPAWLMAVGGGLVILGAPFALFNSLDSPSC